MIDVLRTYLLVRLANLLAINMDAERPNLRYHAERGNEMDAYSTAAVLFTREAYRAIPMSRIYTWFLMTLVPWLVLLGGVGGVWHGVGYLLLAWQSSAWPQTAGSVIRSEVRSEGRFEQGADTERYWAEIEYQYLLAGTTYRSSARTLDGLRLGPQVGVDREAAEEVASRFPVGQQVAVFYDPAAPERATLATGVGVSNLFVPVFGVVLILLSLTWLGYMPFSRSLSRSSPQLDREWEGRPRTCPRCQKTFTSVQDKGGCPDCGHVFYASEAAVGEEGVS